MRPSDDDRPPESFTPNWKAAIDGKPVAVTMHDGLFQSVDVPAGASTLKFTYGCPHGTWTVPMFWLGALVFVAAGGVEFRAKRPAAA